MAEQFTVAGIGELLWDVFPNHKRIGGAPANFAFHTQQLGAKAYPVSCIGTDELGEELREIITKLSVNSDFLKESASYPTGKVDVVLKAGKPTYEIHENVAWDHIPFSSDIIELAGRLDAVCFGSLSQRSEVSRKTIQSFVSEMRDDSLKIFDVNLRQSFYSKELIAASLEAVNILKLSDEELPVLKSLFELKGNVEEQLRQLINQFDLRLVAYTRGPDGSLLISAHASDDYPGCEAQVIDTVGAGDSFTATLCIGLLQDRPLNTINRFANEVAGFVCSQIGATPKLPENMTGTHLFV